MNGSISPNVSNFVSTKIDQSQYDSAPPNQSEKVQRKSSKIKSSTLYLKQTVASLQRNRNTKSAASIGSNGAPIDKRSTMKESRSKSGLSASSSQQKMSREALIQQHRASQKSLNQREKSNSEVLKSDVDSRRETEPLTPLLHNAMLLNASKQTS